MILFFLFALISLCFIAGIVCPAVYVVICKALGDKSSVYEIVGRL